MVHAMFWRKSPANQGLNCRLEFCERCDLMMVASLLTVPTVLRPSVPARTTWSSLRLYDDRVCLTRSRNTWTREHVTTHLAEICRFEAPTQISNFSVTATARPERRETMKTQSFCSKKRQVDLHCCQLWHGNKTESLFSLVVCLCSSVPLWATLGQLFRI